MSPFDLSTISAFDVARLAAAAAAGWGLVSAFWTAVSGAFSAGMTAYARQSMTPEQLRALANLQESIRRNRNDDKTPPGPPAAA